MLTSTQLTLEQVKEISASIQSGLDNLNSQQQAKQALSLTNHLISKDLNEAHSVMAETLQTKIDILTNVVWAVFADALQTNTNFWNKVDNIFDLIKDTSYEI